MQQECVAELCISSPARPISQSFQEVDALAGAGGIEPPNGGIKIRCLTAWLRPNRLFRGTAAADWPPNSVPAPPVYRERSSHFNRLGVRNSG